MLVPSSTFIVNCVLNISCTAVTEFCNNPRDKKQLRRRFKDEKPNKTIYEINVGWIS